MKWIRCNKLPLEAQPRMLMELSTLMFASLKPAAKQHLPDMSYLPLGTSRAKRMPFQAKRRSGRSPCRALG